MPELQSNEDIIRPAKDRKSLSFGIALGELGRSVKNLAQSEGALARAELKNSMTQLSKDILQEVIFGTLLVLSVLSFLAFLIIGLGRLLDDNFWLSSLILSIVLGLVGGGMAYRGLQKIKKNDLTLPRTRQLFQKGSDLHNVVERVAEKMGKSKGAADLQTHSSVDESKIGRVS